MPDGYTPVRPATYNTMTLLRSILASLSEKDEQAGNELVKQIRIYPLSKAANPPAQRLLDMTEIVYNGLIKFDKTFFASLSRTLNEETLQPRDLQMMGMLLPLGIETGKEFKPNAETVAFHDHRGKPLEGGSNYRLHVPANVPVSQFWPFTVYSLKTSSFFLNSSRLTLSSLDKGLRKNPDGSVDIDIGPKPPAGQASNWLYTPVGQKWFPWFRVYGPEKAIMDKSWKLQDIERIT